jgi:hypothetical protein
VKDGHVYVNEKVVEPADIRPSGGVRP